MKNFKISMVAFAVVAAVLAAGFAISTDNSTADYPVVGYFLEDIIECS